MLLFPISTLDWFNHSISFFVFLIYWIHRTNSISLFTPFLVIYDDEQGHLLCKCIELKIDSSDVGRCPFAHFYVYIHSSTNWWDAECRNAYIHMCIYAYLRVCVYLFSTVNCILVIQEYEHSLFIFRCRYILTKKYLVKFFCARMCLSSLFFF
jgi:hypothetical protein